MRIKLQLAVRSLNVGGAERQFLELARNIDPKRFEVGVVVLRPGSLDLELARACNVEVHCLRKQGLLDVAFLARWASLIRARRPDIIYSFMMDMNVMSSIALKLSRHRACSVWGIFGSEPDFSKGPRFLRTLFALQRLLEDTADLITSDSFRGFDFLSKYGYSLGNSEVIFSGTNIRRFRPDPELREAFRRGHGISDDEIVIGICSRLVPMKGYPILSRVARRLLAEHPRVRFFAVGYGDDRIRVECNSILGTAAHRFTWLGRQISPETCMNGWDIYCSSSIYGEGFSNSIIEAMSCGLPCVATDVGDARIQIGDSGIVVEPDSEVALYRALKKLVVDPYRRSLGTAARQRVVDNFTTERMVRRTEDALHRLLGSAPPMRWDRRSIPTSAQVRRIHRLDEPEASVL